MSQIFKNLVFILLSVFLLDSYVNSWDNHNITSLRLLQIVHRHAERTVLENNIPISDPFKNISNWSEGYGQLTKKGKGRMYKIGENLRNWYTGYLSNTNSPRLVYARSSIESRCIESVSALLSGMYPPKDNWTWGEQGGLGQRWQPFPIETFMPKDEDTVLVPHKKCPKANEEHNIISNSKAVKKIVKDFHGSPLYPYIKEVFQDPIESLYRGQQYWDTLKIEFENHKIWPEFKESNHSKNHTQEEIIKALEPFGIGSYMYDWNREFILKIRLGKLIEILISNMNSVINGQKPEEKKELYIYSTHDSIVVPLMQALGHYNNLVPPYGGALLFELHEQVNNTPGYFVQVYYYNETDPGGKPILLMEMKNFKEFESSNKKWYYSDFDKECGIESKPSLILSEMTFMVIGIAIGIGLLGLNIFAYKYIRDRKNTFQISK